MRGRSIRRALIIATGIAILAVVVVVLARAVFPSTPKNGSTSRSSSSASASLSAGTSPGWLLDASKTGLAPFGLFCARLPVYQGSYEPAAGSVISEKRFTRPLGLFKGNIRIERSCMQPTTASPGLPLLATTNYNTLKITKKTVTIIDSEIDGSLLGDQLSAQVTGFLGVADLKNNYIHDVGSGIAIFNAGPKLSSVVEGNYVAKLRAWGDPRTTGNHSDGFTVRDFADAPGRTLIVRNNRIDCNSGNDSGAFFIQTYSGNIANVTAEGNLLEGGGYQLVLGAGYNHTYKNMRAINNRLSGTGAGPAHVDPDGPGWAQATDNYINDPGQPDNRGQPVPM
jgi:hypothetical protein